MNYHSVYASELLIYGSGTWGQQNWAAKDIQVATHNDTDNDGVFDENDAFPEDPSEWLDTDLDNIGNNADPDDDNDFILDSDDLFPLISISGLPDNDMDGAPNECETACKALGMTADGDDDNDNVIDSIDVYPFINLSGLADNDGDGAPDTCDDVCIDLGMLDDDDDDNDGVLDDNDAYPLISVEGYDDNDNDGIPDSCSESCFLLGLLEDFDDDNDDIVDTADAYPLVSIGELTDTDSDGAPDTCDEACVELGMLADSDDDNDGYLDLEDDFPLNSTEWVDTDQDGFGNNADFDDDNDKVLDLQDAFPLDSSEWLDNDLDGIGNNADTDDDNDGIVDTADAYPLISIGELTDTDSDGAPDECDDACVELSMAADDDDDNDGVVDASDAYPLVAIGELTDTDSDGAPDTCDDACVELGMAADDDDDGDGVLDTADTYPLIAIGELTDTDSDGVPDMCDDACVELGMVADDDDDGDGIVDTADTYPLISIGELTDTDSDGAPDECDDACVELGMAADTDDDNDGIADTSDTYPLVAIGELTDTDSDGAPNACDDACVELGMAADTDDDNDGVVDASDAYPLIAIGELTDTDSDGAPDTCDEVCVELGMLADTDDDNDGIADTSDTYPLIAVGELIDTDSDGAPDTCDEACVVFGMAADTDDDNDGIADTADTYPLISIGSLTDTDSDGAPDTCDDACVELGMAADTDDDNDGIADTADTYPLIAIGELTDTDSDGVPDMCDDACVELGMVADDDDDGDGIVDTADTYPLIAIGELTDTDSDGVPDACDEACVALGMVADTDDDNDGVLDEVDVFPLDSTKTTLLDDDSAPVVLAPADIYVDATGELTIVDIGVATVEDNLEELVATADNLGPFASGETVVTWTALDSAGNEGTGEQRIFIQPYVEIAVKARMAQGDSVSIPITLSGASYSYPVLIPVSVNVEGVSLSTSEIEIRSGMSAILEVTLPESQTLSAASFKVTLGVPTNAVLGQSNQMQVMIVEDAAPPKVSLVVTQDDVLGRYITQTDSVVDVQVFIDDVNGNHAIGWEYADALASLINDDVLDTLSFNPQSLAPGNYTVKVKVADDGLPGELFTRELTLKVSGFSKLLDADDDGIPDDVDITLASNAIQLSQSSTDIVQANAGVKLSLGNTAADNEDKGIEVDETDLPVVDALLAYPLGLLDFEAQLNVPGEALELVVPLAQGIPEGAIYRKLIDGRWRDFVSGDGNGIASAAVNDEGVCPIASSEAYQTGLTPGDTCLRLTIVDGGPNDADGEVNGHVVDPGGIAIVDEDAGIPAYTYLEQPQPQFATLTPTAKVIVTGSQGDNFFDIARYVNDVTLVGQSFLVSGSGGVDGFMVMPGVKYDLANLKGGVDGIYFSGPFAEYADSILLDPGSGVMQLSRLTDIGEEIVQFIATASAADELVFTDGAISTADVKAAVINETPMGDLVLDNSVSALDTKPISGGTVKHIVLDNNGAGVMALGPNISTLISGSSGVDQIYVPAGSVVDASNLKSGQDEIYLEGALVDYSLSLDNSGNITLTRDITVNDENVTEQVTVASGSNVATNDLVIFTDQQVDTATLKQQVLN